MREEKHEYDIPKVLMIRIEEVKLGRVVYILGVVSLVEGNPLKAPC